MIYCARVGWGIDNERPSDYNGLASSVPKELHMDVEVKPKKKCGFNVISKERRIEISTLGGIAVQAQGKGHKWTVCEAQQAGRIGGKVTQDQRREIKEVRKALADIENEINMKNG